MRSFSEEVKMGVLRIENLLGGFIFESFSDGKDLFFGHSADCHYNIKMY